MIEPEKARIVRIENTLDLGEIWVSEAMIGDVQAHPQMELVGETFEAEFDGEGNLGHF